MSNRALWLAPLVFTLGCNGGGTGPSEGVPSVAGNYSGTSTYTTAGGQTSSETCPATLTVTQSRNLVALKLTQ